MASNPTDSELRKAAEVTDDEITAAVDAVLADMSERENETRKPVLKV